MLIALQNGALLERRIANIFAPKGTQAAVQYQVAMFTLGITGVMFVVVAGLLVYTMIRFRRRKTDAGNQEPPQVYGSNQIEIAWTFIPILGVFVLIGVTTRFIMSLQDATLPSNTEHITVIGHQWWWEVKYPDYGVVTANEIHIPENTRVLLQLESADVIHSFWVPQIAGKTDLIPGRANTMWIDAHEPGIYAGNCAEYCGTQHANMLLRVFAEPQAAYRSWLATERVSASAAGREVFESIACVNCHTIRGTRARGVFGPDLTHLMSRTTLASGMIRNTAENLRRWVVDPQSIKPGCLMPAMKLSDAETNGVLSYLESLH
ncbi:MAG TPA: cytochrome c oxidase subunit II [Candidatus Sulfotelmatobacter sp.]|nr:cytochrome c oxidase subunit II [Candidatus Sulfotelmatobacter sp.]